MRRLTTIATLLGTILLIFYFVRVYQSSYSNRNRWGWNPEYDNEEVDVDGKKALVLDDQDLDGAPSPNEKIEGRFSRAVTVKPTTKSRMVKLVNAEAVRKSFSFGFVEALKKTANDQQQVMIGVVDVGYVKFALNFQRLCVDRLRIANFLMVCVDRLAVTALKKYDIDCTLFDLDIRMTKERTQRSLNKDASDFGTPEYYRKTNLKTAVVIQALHLRYNVLMVDLDVILFRDPFPYFSNCSDCDALFQMDRQMYNTGFAYVRPTVSARMLYEAAWNLYAAYQRGHDQTYVNMAATIMGRQNFAVKIVPLSTKQFLCGVYYFAHAHRMFENKPACADCVVAHNNYLGSVSAKVYRFKENLLWTVDEENYSNNSTSFYYSNKSAKYMTYDNPIHTFEGGVGTMDAEVEALKYALAVSQILNRTLILPRFHCCHCLANVKCSHPQHQCSLLSVLRVRQFDKYFYKQYRENSFLKNPLVPSKIVNSVSPVLRINVTVASKDTAKYASSETVTLSSPKPILFQPSGSDGATVDEIQGWLGPYSNVSVVRFHSMYGILSAKQFKRDRQFAVLRNRITAGFVCSEYEQWETSGLEFVIPES